MKPTDESELFARVLDMPVEEREAFLTAACGEDAGLRRRLETLLAAHEQPDTMLAGQSGTLPPAERISFSPTRAEESVGQRLDRFKLLEKLGEGGCGVVYVAEQTEPVRRRVALKVIKLGMDTKQVIARFEAERQALAMMDHPNIAKVLDAGTTGQGRPYFVMELVRGIPITDYCDQTNLPMAERLDLFIKVCRAIQHAHQKGIIHRDIKPSNILVTLHDGVPVPKVIDFGIAKATEGRLADATVYTQLHQFVGTPAYMSPEQAEMSGLDIDTRSDIYSLGVLLYELLAGRTPFDGRELVSMGIDAMRRTIREAEPVRPSTRLATLSGEELTTAARRRSADTARLLHLLKGDLDWIVMKCLEKDRQRRYETANGLAADIRRHLANEPVDARPPSALYKFRKAWRRNRLVFNAGAAVSGALLLGIFLATWQAKRARAERHRAEQARQVAVKHEAAASFEAQRAASAEKGEKELRMIAEQQRLAARRRAYAADMLLCQQALVANNLREARQLLDRQRPGEGEEDLRGWEWRHLWLRCRSSALFELGPRTTRGLSARYSADGKKVLTYEDGGRVSRWDLNSRTEEAVLQEGDDSSRAILRSNSGLMTVSDDGGRLAASGRQPDGSYVIRIWDLVTGTLVCELPTGSHHASALAISPDQATLVAIIPGAAKAVMWDIGTKARRKEINLGDGEGDGIRQQIYGAAKYSRAGRFLATGGGTDIVHLLDLQSGKERLLEVPGHGGIRTMDFSPDGRRLAICRGFIDPTIRIFDIGAATFDADRKPPVQELLGHNGFIADLEFSADGRLMATAGGDQTIKIWDTATWAEVTTLLGHTDEVWSVAFSRDGQHLLSSGKDKRVLIWSLANAHQQAGIQTMRLKGLKSLDASPDGRSFVTIYDGVVHLQGATSSIHEELGTNNVFAAWASKNEILLGVTEPNQIKAWNLDDQSVASFPLTTQAGTPIFVYLPATRQLVSAVEDTNQNTVTFARWDVVTRRKLSACVINDLPIRTRNPALDLRRTMSQDGRRLAILRPGNQVEIYDLTTGRMTTTWQAQEDAIQGLGISPDGNLVASAARDVPEIDIQEVSTGKKRTTLHGHNLVLLHIGFSTDGSRMVSSTIGSEPVKLWDTRSWHAVFSFASEPGTFLWQPWFCSDGNTISMAKAVHSTREATIRVWQAPTMEQINAAEARPSTSSHGTMRTR
ncbi:MAG: protein kinase [Verrucomicrobiae bacterium]|nr:protein kinase [Verrucomicrobiae bacterium]